MNKQYRHQLDLLQIRRSNNNINKSSSRLIKKLRSKGMIIGCIVSLAGVSLCSYTAAKTYLRVKFKEKLILKANEYEDLKNTYKTNLKDLKSIYKTNDQIAKGIIGIRSGSALLTEIKEIIPTTIQLDSISSQEGELKLLGLANEPNALDSINSLKLQISNSFLIKNRSTILDKASESNINKKSLKFELSSSFLSPKAEKLMSNYEKLGSLGLFKRVRLLYKEGLIK
tara:strand:+ start:2175 stop:2855 length:681 start_codon:yes stop_codon:yes gene_type:complete